jgi:hypothetical protein
MAGPGPNAATRVSEPLCDEPSAIETASSRPRTRVSILKIVRWSIFLRRSRRPAVRRGRDRFHRGSSDVVSGGRVAASRLKRSRRCRGRFTARAAVSLDAKAAVSMTALVRYR